MKHYLSLLFLCCWFTCLFGQKLTECAAEVDPGGHICYDNPMCLATTQSAFYNTPPNIQWSFVSYTGSGSVTPAQIGFVDPHGFTTCVINNTGSLTWPVGTYTFQLCVDCQDLNHDSVHDRPCAFTTVVVDPEPTSPVITELDGAPDGQITGCSDITFNINSLSLAAGEQFSVVALPDDNLVEITVNAGVVSIHRNDTGNPFFQGECEYKIIYSISNGGCVRSASVNARFIKPYDPNNDGTIEGYINVCPACTNTVDLIGDRPGCGGLGRWGIVQGPPGYTASFTEYPTIGDATVTVSLPGHYVFDYTVTNIAPCPDSHFQIECDIFEVGEFTLGPDIYYTFCDDKLPAGTYPVCFNQLDNVIYTWPTSNSVFEIPAGSTNCADIYFPQDADLSQVIYVTLMATRYYVDWDCDGPGAPEVIKLPYTDPAENLKFIEEFMATHDACFYTCVDYANVRFYGAPKIDMESENINFLCSSGTETVRIGDYFEVTNGVPYFADIKVLQDPSGQLGTTVSEGQLLQLPAVGGCATYVFEINANSYNYQIYPPIICTTTDTLTIVVATRKEVTAGTDQIKCPTELIRLNANNPYCGVSGTWTRIYCSSLDFYNVEIDDVTDPNTIIEVTGPLHDTICPPDTLCFVWSFTSENGDCNLSDTTRVIIRDSCCNMPPNPCPQNLQVVSQCVENTLILTVLGDNMSILDPILYTIVWTAPGATPSSFTGNPFVINPATPVNYTVEIYKIVNGQRICYTRLTGTAKCDIVGCNAKIVERCDEYGNIILTLVNAITGNIILPSVYDEIFWTIYGGGANDPSGYMPNPQQNPITIQQGACYSLRYQHIIPPHILECTFNFPKVCPTITCPGPCENFDDFFIAGCGDLLDQTLNLTFPNGCQSFCGNLGTTGMLGLFYKSTNLPVIPSPSLTITWKDGTHGTYASGSLNLISKVTVTNDRNCFWMDSYVPQCCSTPTPYIECQQPITKYCREDGSVYYVTGLPQISWTPVPGATGYVVEITTGTIEGCCTAPTGVTTQQVSTNVYVIPPGTNCFSIRIKAIIPGCPDIQSPGWSNTYVYCPREVVCNPVLIVCGCCHGRSDDNTLGLQTQSMSEEDLLVYLKENPGTEYNSLQDALYAIGIETAKTTDFKVFPNPASDQIVVQGNNSVKGNFQVQLTDMLQREWRNVSFDGANGNTLNVSDLPKGIYLITIRNANGERVLTEKITVLR